MWTGREVGKVQEKTKARFQGGIGKDCFYIRTHATTRDIHLGVELCDAIDTEENFWPFIVVVERPAGDDINAGDSLPLLWVFQCLLYRLPRRLTRRAASVMRG